MQNIENAGKAAELNIANKELAFQIREKAERAAELIIANRELTVQSSEKADFAAKLIIANKEQGEYFVNISHELKTPLNVINSASQLVKMYCNNGSCNKNKDLIIKYIDSTKQNCYRFSKLINI